MNLLENSHDWINARSQVPQLKVLVWSQDILGLSYDQLS